MAQYLVTGAAGFIGSALVRALLERGERVRGFDNFETGKREHIREVAGQIDFREADLLDLKAVHSACQEWTTCCTRQPFPRCRDRWKIRREATRSTSTAR